MSKYGVISGPHWVIPGPTRKKNLYSDTFHTAYVKVKAQRISAEKIVPQIFKILFQTGNIIVFAAQGVRFSWYVQVKSSFSAEKNISGGI